MNNSNQSVANKKSRNGKTYAEITTAYQGPLPAPEILGGFEAVLPGAAERIMKMAEKEQNYRHKRDNRLAISAIVSMIVGIFFAFLSVLIIAYLVYFAVSKENTEVAIALSSITFVGAITAFIRFRKENKKD